MRFIIPYKQYKIELDIFKGEYDGIIFAEVEFPTVKEAKEFDLIIPDWFGVEISNYITNSDMAFGNPKDIKKSLENVNKHK